MWLDSRWGRDQRDLNPVGQGDGHPAGQGLRDRNPVGQGPGGHEPRATGTMGDGHPAGQGPQGMGTQRGRDRGGGVQGTLMRPGHPSRQGRHWDGAPVEGGQGTRWGQGIHWDRVPGRTGHPLGGGHRLRWGQDTQQGQNTPRTCHPWGQDTPRGQDPPGSGATPGAAAGCHLSP